MPSIYAHFLPQLVTPEALAGGTVVVIDVLRATTTITYALASGAKLIVPCGEIDAARRIAVRLKGDSPGAAPLLGGERGGVPIDGFDIGNSPCEFTPARVAGRTIVFTTTNGTRAMLHCRQAARVLLGSFVSLQAVVERLRGADRVHLLCAGTEGEVTREDVLVAGAITHGLMLPKQPGASDAQTQYMLNDEARIACDAWQATLPPAELPQDNAPPPWLVQALADSKGGRNLQRVGLARDLADCAALDRFAVVPELDVARGEIRAAQTGTITGAWEG